MHRHDVEVDLVFLPIKSAVPRRLFLHLFHNCSSNKASTTPMKAPTGLPKMSRHYWDFCLESITQRLLETSLVSSDISAGELFIS